MRTLIRRMAKLRNTISLQTFPRDLNVLYNWSDKTNVFFGMNHDFVRTSIILRLLETLGIDAFVETGTHLGRTCFLVASQTDLPIFTSEVNRKYMWAARWFLKCFGSRVHLSCMDSVQFLNGLLAHEQFRRPLFYLDAHWYSRLPLIEELGTILESVESFVIVIDDFRVPGDANFGFDRYGKTVVEWKLIEQVLVDSGRHMVAYLPSYPSSLEVGDRRGWIVIASFDNERLLSEAVPIDLLKIHTVIGSSTLLKPVHPNAYC
jgi:hypothetical protein